MFEEINIEFAKLSNDRIKDMKNIIKKQTDTRYAHMQDIKDIMLITVKFNIKMY